MCCLCPSISQEEGIDIVCHHYEEHYQSSVKVTYPYFIFGRLNAGDLNRKLSQIHRQTLRTDSRHYNGHQNRGCFLGHFHGSRWETTTTCEPLQPFLRLEEIYWWHILSVDSFWVRNQQLYWFRELFPHNNKIYTDELSSKQIVFLGHWSF